MKRLVLLFLLAGCGESTAPAPVVGSFALRSVDGAPLPVVLPGMGEGFVLEAGALSFGSGSRPRRFEPRGLVTRTWWVRRPDQGPETWSATLRYQVTAGILHLDLCPIGALCVVSSELVGPVDPVELVLTERTAGVAGPTYRYAATCRTDDSG